MPGEMITKLLSLLATIVRHPINASRPQSAFQKRFEPYEEFWSLLYNAHFSHRPAKGVRT
jgi:hypothetical protein